MREKYFNFLKQSLLSPNEIKNTFLLLIKYFEISELRKIPQFEQLKDAVIQLNISPQYIFAKVAMHIVQRKKLANLKFLIDECGYDLTQTHDDKNITLLHEACLFSSISLIEYLLQKGFSPNVQDDSRGETPLHRLFKRNDSKDSAVLIRLLKQYGANLNIQTSNGVTALHMSLIHKNPKAATTLIELGASQELIWNGFTYLTLKTAIEQGRYQVKPPSALLPPKEDIAEEALAEYCKGCMLPKCDKLIFENVIKGLLEAEKLTLLNIQTFIQSTILMSQLNPFQSKLLQKNLFLLIKQNKLSHSDAVYYVLKVSEFFEDEKQTVLIKEFNSLALALLKPEKITVEKQCDFYYVIGFRYKIIGLLQKSEHYLQLSLEKASLKTDEFKTELFFNLACTQKLLMKDEAALNNFRNAFNLNKKDIISFQRYISSLLQCDQYEEALTICHEANFGKYSEIFAAFTHVLCGDSSWSDLLEIVSEDALDEESQILSLDLRAECYLKRGDYTEALKAAEASFILKEKSFKKSPNNDSVQPIFKLLQVLIQAGNYQAGLERFKVLEESYSFELNCSVLCQGAATVLYIANQQFEQAERLIQKIDKLGVDTHVLSHIYFLLGMEVLSTNSKNNVDMALHYINLALKLNPSHLKGQFYKFMLLILIGNKTVAEKALQTIEPEVLLDISLAKNVLREVPALPESILDDISVGESTTEIMSKSEDISQEEKDPTTEEEKELTVEDFDPVKIHQFFQREKQHLLSKSMNHLSPIPQPKAKWKIGAVSFEEGKDGLILIKHHSYFPCYVVIHPHLPLDTKLREKFQAALDKGVAIRKDTDGVQTLHNAVIQLAIRSIGGNNRPYTTSVCLNENGQYLIVFDKYGKHKEVKRIARQRQPLQVVPSIQANSVPAYIERSDSVFTVPQTTQLPNEQISNTTSQFYIPQ